MRTQWSHHFHITVVSFCFVIVWQLLEAPVLVHRGEPVVIELRGASFAIRTTGRALASGSAGARVAVENPASKRVVHGTVTAPGQVTVGF